MQVKLHEVIGTRYIISTIKDRLRTVLNEQLDKGNDVDLAGCKFGPDSVRVMQEFYGKIKFLNTEDAELQVLLDNNWDVVANPDEEYEVLDISEFNKDNWTDKIENLPTGSYKIKISLVDHTQAVIALLLIMARPDVEFDISDCSTKIVSLITNHVDYDSFKDDEYVLICNPPYIHKERMEDIRRGRDIVIPCDIGSERLVSFKETIKMNTRYKELIHYLSDVVNKAFYTTNEDNVKKEEEVDVFDYLKLRE